MSKPFADIAGRLAPRAVAASVLALTLAACGSSTPRQAEVQAPRETAAPAAPPAPVVARAEERADEAAQPDRRRERRNERRADAEQGVDPASADEPVPEEAAASYARAVAAIRAENWLEAELELEQLTLAYPQYPGPYVNLALVYLHDGRRDDARDALERALAVEPNHPHANTQLGILLREEGEFAEAEAAYRRALDGDPEHSLAHYNLGVLLDLYLRRTAEALEHYEAYQASLEQPNETVARWIIDLRRRVGNGDAARVAQEGGQ